MALSLTKKASIEGTGIRVKLLIIEALVVVLPFLVLAYIIYTNQVFLDSYQMFFLVLILILILAGLMTLRRIFDRFLMLNTLMKNTLAQDEVMIDIHKDKDELRQISISFNSLMNKFEATTSDLTQRVLELFTVKELIEVASKSLNIDDLLNLLLEKSMAVSNATIGSVFLVESEKERFRVVASKGLELGPGGVSYIKFEQSIVQSVVFERKPLLIENIETDSRTRKPNNPKYGPPSFMSMPIFSQENLLAVLNLSHKETNAVFDVNDQQILSILIAEIGFALENAQLHSELEEHLKNLENRTKELHLANDKLQQEVTERKRAEVELQKSREIALDANRAKSDFLANMSHEIRTPLNHIIGFTELVVDKKVGELNEVQEDYLNDVLHSSKHLLALINDILDLSKVEAGKLELESSDVNLKLLLEKSMTMIKEESMKHQIKLLMDLGEVPETINADERKLRQILYNLLSNAVKFTFKGGSITLAARHLLLVDGLLKRRDGREIVSPLPGDRWPTSHGNFVEISVTDTGIGIKREDLDRIFNPFEQMDSSASRKYQGTGLGLSLTRSLVELHGGRIWVESEGGTKGSTFRFVIPI